jgi:hypothetical protein
MRMVRRIFQLPLDDAEWLDAEARRTHQAVAGIIRRAVRMERATQTALSPGVATEVAERPASRFNLPVSE